MVVFILGQSGIILEKFEDMSQYIWLLCKLGRGSKQLLYFHQSLLKVAEKLYACLYLGLVAFPGVKAYFCWYEMLPIWPFSHPLPWHFPFKRSQSVGCNFHIRDIRCGLV